MTPWFLKKINDEITLNVTASIKKSRPIISELHHIDQ